MGWISALIKRASQVVLVDGRHPSANVGDARDAGSISGSKRSAGEACMPGKFYGQRSLAGYNPWGHKQARLSN